MGRLSFRSKPNAQTVPELPELVTWVRFAIAVLSGLSLGYRNETKGLSGLLFGLNVITFVPMFWFNQYLDANIESYKSLNFVGVANAFALCLLIWITIFTMRHEEDEISLGKVISDAAITAVKEMVQETVDPVTVQSQQEDSEF